MLELVDRAVAVLEKVVQVRYMYIAMGCFSAVLTACVVGTIWYDSWRASKLKIQDRTQYVDTYPLCIALPEIEGTSFGLMAALLWRYSSSFSLILWTIADRI